MNEKEIKRLKKSLEFYKDKCKKSYETCMDLAKQLKQEMRKNNKLNCDLEKMKREVQSCHEYLIEFNKKLGSED